MGKQARDRRLADHEAGAQGRNLRTSPQKLNLVAQSIQGKDVEAALAELTFSKRRIAGLVKKVLPPLNMELMVHLQEHQKVLWDKNGMVEILHFAKRHGNLH